MYSYYHYGSSSATEESFFESMGVMGFIILLVSLAVLIWIAFKMVAISNDKGYDYCSGRIFILCFLVNIIGYIYVIALPDLKIQRQNERIIELLTNIDKNQDVNTRTNQSILMNISDNFPKQQSMGDPSQTNI